MARGVEMRDLRLIVAIAAEGSLAGAARSLDYSQPTASQHLAGLEARLGAHLVDRGPHGAALTEAGELLATYAEEILERVDTVEGDVRRQADYGVSTLRLGTFPSAGAGIAPRAIATLAAEGLHVQMLEAEVPELLLALQRRQVHAALVFLPDPDGPHLALDGIHTTHVLEDEHLVVLPRGHAAGGRASVDLEDLRDEAWIAAPADDDPSYSELIVACRERGFEPAFSHRISSCSITQALVAAGLGVSLVPRIALEPERTDVVAIPLRGAHIIRSIHVAYLASLDAGLRKKLLEAIASASS
ncbi:MAG: LysR family transcriptional regulator [Actinobacteria bacterium]|nr:LysR family transcriptional regulator [Actinomycetota bacterium]